MMEIIAQAVRVIDYENNSVKMKKCEYDAKV